MNPGRSKSFSCCSLICAARQKCGTFGCVREMFWIGLSLESRETRPGPDMVMNLKAYRSRSCSCCRGAGLGVWFLAQRPPPLPIPSMLVGVLAVSPAQSTRRSILRIASSTCVPGASLPESYQYPLTFPLTGPRFSTGRVIPVAGESTSNSLIPAVIGNHTFWVTPALNWFFGTLSYCFGTRTRRYLNRTSPDMIGSTLLMATLYRM